jgi:hypothetical protein
MILNPENSGAAPLSELRMFTDDGKIAVVVGENPLYLSYDLTNFPSMEKLSDMGDAYKSWQRVSGALPLLFVLKHALRHIVDHFGGSLPALVAEVSAAAVDVSEADAATDNCNCPRCNDRRIRRDVAPLN